MPPNEAQSVYLSVILPAYNEAERLPKTLESVLAHLASKDWTWEVLVSDDGSRDATPDLVEQRYPQCRVARAPCNQGKGAAVRRGMLAARGRFRLFSDADLSTPIDEIDAMLGEMERGGYDVVIASRALPESRLEVHQPRWREWSGRLFNFLVRPISGLPFPDTQCGFKLFRAEAARRLFSRQRSDGWAFDVEILMLAKAFGYKMRDWPVRWINDAASRVTLWSDAPRMLCDIMLFRLRSLSGRLARREPTTPEPDTVDE